MAVRMSKKTRIILACVIIAVGAVVGIALSRDSTGPSDSTPQPQEAPDFILPTMTGANITLSQLEGTPVILNFWSISCSWCRKQLPYLERVAQQSEGETMVVAVNTIDSAAGLQTFFVDYEPTMTVALDHNRVVFENYCVAFDNARGAIPFTLFIDSEGLVQYVQVGAFASEAALWDKLSSVLGITAPQTS